MVLEFVISRIMVGWRNGKNDCTIIRNHYTQILRRDAVYNFENQSSTAEGRTSHSYTLHTLCIPDLITPPFSSQTVIKRAHLPPSEWKVNGPYLRTV